MKLLCLACGNYTYFYSDVQIYRNVTPTIKGLMVDDVVIEDYNFSDSSVRDDLQDNVDYVLKQSVDLLQFNPDSGHYENTLITCARCNSKRVTPPYSKWKPKRNYQSLQKEIMDNKNEFKNLRKEQTHANNLPVLWKP